MVYIYFCCNNVPVKAEARAANSLVKSGTQLSLTQLGRLSASGGNSELPPWRWNEKPEGPDLGQ